MSGLATVGSATFGEFCLDFQTRSLRRFDDTGTAMPVTLGGRAFDILALLVSRPGELVSKNDLFDAVWPGLAIEEANLTVQISALRRALGKHGGSLVQTVPGRGYRFTAIVTHQVGTTMPDSPSPARRAFHPPRLVLFAVIAMLLAGAAGAAGMLIHTPPPRLSIAVLRFGADPNEPALSRFADRLSDGLTADLDRLWMMSVDAPQSSARSIGPALDKRPTARPRDVRYLVEGRLYAVHDQMVVHVDLISAETGKELWTCQTDWPLTDADAAQPRIGSWLQNAIGSAVLSQEAARSVREHPDNPDAMDLYLQGRALLSLPLSSERLHAARTMLDQAVQMDPNAYFAIPALVSAIIDNETDLSNGVTEHDLQHARALVAKAQALAPSAAPVLQAQGYLLRLEQRWPEAEAAYEHIRSLYPNSFYAGFQLGICYLQTGRAVDAIPLFEDALAIGAGRGDLFSRYVRLGEALLLAGRYDDAVPWLRKAEITAVGRAPGIRALPHFLAASALELSGHINAAHDELATATAIFPYASANSFWVDTSSSPPQNASTGVDAFVAQIKHIKQSLIRTGLRVYVPEDAPGTSTQPEILPSQLSGLTPTEVTGAHVISTTALTSLLHRPDLVVLDGNSGQASIPGALSLPWMSRGGVLTDDMQTEFASLLARLTGGDKARPIVTLGVNANAWAGYNLARRAAALGYDNVFWYRGGRDAWAAVAGPMEPLRPDPLMEF